MSTFFKDNVGIFSPDWCDIVFDNQNKEYGAYVQRKTSSKRHLRAIVISIILFILAVSLPVILKSIIPKQKDRQLEVTTLADIKMDQKKKDEKVIELPPEPPPPISTIKFVPPVIKPDEEVSDEDELKQQEDLNKSTTVISSANIKGNDSAVVDLSTLNKGAQDGLGEEEPPLMFVEQMPEFPGGEKELIKFINTQIKYPEIARENGIDGVVYVTFIVGKDGSISDVKILRSPDDILSKEAIRVVKLMPPWKAGKQNNTAVRVQFSLPVRFTLH